MLMLGNLSDWREWTDLAGKRDTVISEDLLHPGRVGTHHRVVSDHHRLMTVADVIGKEAPLAPSLGANHEDRFGTFHDADNEPRHIEDEAVALPQDRAASERRRKFETERGPPSRATLYAIFPAERHRIARIAERCAGQSIRWVNFFRDR